MPCIMPYNAVASYRQNGGRHLPGWAGMPCRYRVAGLPTARTQPSALSVMRSTERSTSKVSIAQLLAVACPHPCSLVVVSGLGCSKEDSMKRQRHVGIGLLVLGVLTGIFL